MKHLNRPTGTGTQYSYNALGMLTGIRNGNTNFQQGGGVNGGPNGAGMEKPYEIGAQYRNLSYAYDGRGFIASRIDSTAGQSETYAYDQLDRLVSHTVNGVQTVTYAYAPNGNITQNSRVGSYAYSKPHAVTQVSGVPSSTAPLPSQCAVEYNLMNKPASIMENGYRIAIDYGANGMRRHTVVTRNNSVVKEKTWVSGLFELEETPSSNRRLDYIQAEGRTVAVRVTQGGSASLYYVLTDHLGSWERVLDGNKASLQQAHFDPWGNRMAFNDWATPQAQTSFLFDRGFTGHEHYDSLRVINANARLYDPVIGRFFSPDPFVQEPDFSQSFNRYSYCMNNPVMYNDPTGEVFVIDDLIAAAAIGAIINCFTQIVAGNVNGAGDFFVAAGIGALSGAAGFAVGALVAETMYYGGFIGGAISGSAAGVTSGFITGSGNAWMQGASFTQGLTTGAIGAATGAGLGALFGGLSQGIIDYYKGYSFWNGCRIDGYTIGSQAIEPVLYDYNTSIQCDINDQLLADRMMDVFGVREGNYGIKEITTGYSNEKYQLLSDGSYFNLKTGSRVGGYTLRSSKGFTTVHISPKYTTSSLVDFKAVAGHELIHAYHHYTIASYNSLYSEIVAYKYTYNVYLQNHRFMNALKVLETAKKLNLNLFNKAPFNYSTPFTP